jgi:hypothetical protein
MKKNLFFGIVMFTVMFGISGCGKSESERVNEKVIADKQIAQSFQFIEDQRSIAKENAEFIAADYRASNPRLSGMKIVGHTDSTISASCPSGDGWASLSMMDVKDNAKNRTSDIEKIKVKCSTVSLNLGCYLEKDFSEKPFSKEEGICNKNLPSPLPKVAK